MPIHCRIDNVRRIVFTKCEGKISYQDFIDHQSKIGVDGSLCGFDEIIDTRKSDLSELGFMALQAIAKRTISLAAISPDACIVVIVNSGINKMVAEMYKLIEQMLGKNSRDMKIALSMDEALSLLGQDKGLP